ncbi:MAG TPA: hypothetical protein VF816_00805 [Rhodocyclaceae bacterium]
MSVSNISSTGLSQLNWRSSVRQARQDFEQLFQAMQAGDVSSAQQAYAGLQQLMPGAASTNATSTSSTGSTDSTASTTSSTGSTAASTGSAAIASDWSALGQALQSGNLSSAQSAFSQLEQDLQAKAQGAGHRHHHREVAQAQALYSAMQIGNAAGATGTAGSGNAVSSDIGALRQALQSGDTAAAQKLLTQLQNDLQNSGFSAGHHHHRFGGFATQAGASAYAGTPATASTSAGTTSDSGGSGTSTTA